VDTVFAAVDKNGDGKLTKEEWAAHLESQGMVASDYQLDMIMNLLDTNLDGFVSKEELTAYAKAYDAAFPEEQAALSFANKFKVGKDAEKWDERDWEQYEKGWEDSRVEMVFQFFDDDHNKVLSRAELKEFLSELYDEAVTDEQLDKVISYCDEDFDGAVSYEEMYNYIV
jgi:Ca2+-binding EF-hand superfamily protein